MKYLAFVLILVQSLTGHAEVRIVHGLGDQCYQEDHVFKMCSHQKDIYDAAFARAKANERELLIVYGYDGCPWSRALVNLLTTSSKADAFKARFEIQPIAASGMNSTGRDVMRDLLRGAVGDPEALIEHVPLLVIVDPKAQATRAITTVELERNDVASKWYGHDLSKLAKALGVE